MAQSNTQYIAYFTEETEQILQGTLHPSEIGQFEERTTNPSRQADLQDARESLIRTIERTTEQNGWTRRLYESYARIISMVRGVEMPEWQSDLEEENVVDDGGNQVDTEELPLEDVTEVAMDPALSGMEKEEVEMEETEAKGSDEEGTRK